MFLHRFHQHVGLPDLVPELSRGKHRHPRKGACFMEFASYLAGERWSDHPTCTHPLLGSLARLVNDQTSDAGRQRLIELVPSVIGLTSDDPRVEVHIPLRAATVALPVVAEGRQRILAVSVLAANRVLADLDGRAANTLDERSRRALAQTPEAAEWARDFTHDVRSVPSLRSFRHHAAPVMLRHSVIGIAHACVGDPDGILYALLSGAIDDCATRAPTHGRCRTEVPYESRAPADSRA